jgi:hypothetical protein
VCSVPYVPDVPGRSAAVSNTTPTLAVGTARLRPQASRIGTSSSGAGRPPILDDVERVTVYQRTANWCTPLNNRPITLEEQVELKASSKRCGD